jgi:ATP-dependent helicase/nuclease subunit B
MPHSSAQADTALSRSITERILHSAQVVCFSSTHIRGTAEAKPSGLIVSFVGLPAELPDNLVPDELAQPQTIVYEDHSAVPHPGTKAEGGVGTLAKQSQCAFSAFATARLGARDWDAAEVGLNPRQRGELVHSVLRSVWGGAATDGLSSSVELQAVLASNGKEGLSAFIQPHVHGVMLSLPASIRDRMPTRYLDLEEQRLLGLVTEWLAFESRRARFTVAETEKKTPVVVAGLSLDLRLDRRDVLDDGSTVILDYKTGEASPNEWESDRPENVQLPIYAVYGVESVVSNDPGGLVFASVKPGNAAFAGRIRDTAMFLPDINTRHALATNPLTDQQLLDWRTVIDGLATDFLQGQATVLPRDYPSTCKYCSLSGLCRVVENRLTEA